MLLEISISRDCSSVRMVKMCAILLGYQEARKNIQLRTEYSIRAIVRLQVSVFKLFWVYSGGKICNFLSI